MRIGFHIPFSGNLKRLATKVRTSRGNTFQFYSRTIRGGRIPKVSEKQLYDYYNFLFEKKISTVIMHVPYGFKIGKDISSNLAVKNEEAVGEILKDLEYAKKVRAKYYVINSGYKKEQSEFQAYENVKKQLEEILDKTLWDGDILIRNMSGGGTEIGQDLLRWNELISFNDRVKGALDFSRAYAYGYNFLNVEDANNFLMKLKSEIGMEKIPLIYINDTNRFSGSKKDDYAPLGEGVIGYHGYSNILSDIVFEKKIWMIENQPDATYYDRSIEFLYQFHKNYRRMD